MLNITNIPAPRVQIIDERTGFMSREWYLFFLNLYNLTGSGSNDVSLQDLQLSPQADYPHDDSSDLTQNSEFGALYASPSAVGTIASLNFDGDPTAGGVIYGNGIALAATPAGVSGQILTSQGSLSPKWANTGDLGNYAYAWFIS
jgi:hypothetical protein